MPGSNYIEISSRLTAAGFAEETPCAIISRATTPEQQIYRTTSFGSPWGADPRVSNAAGRR
jgi:siroheme synthase